jgi:Ser/Thr protein kinase RdoA (MazF antagonist)
MTWVDGRSLAHYLTRRNLYKMGILFARLHVHGGIWSPPAGFTTRRFDAFLSRGEPDLLFGGGALRYLGQQDFDALLRARSAVEKEYANLDRGDLRVIHCDLWHGNIKVDGGRLRPFDFEDTVWGYRLHDIAMGMLDLLETVGQTRYHQLLAAFRQGYEGLLDWPAGDMQVLQFGRLLWKANWVARFQPQHLEAMAQGYARVWRQLEQDGVLALEPSS